MVADISWLGYFMPIIGFFFVFIVVVSILKKTEILGDNPFVNLFVGFIFATIFITFSPAVDFIQTIIPWVVVLVLCLLFVFILLGFSEKDVGSFTKGWLGWVVVAALAIVFLISALVVFNPVLQPYLPGTSGAGGDPYFVGLKDFFYSEAVVGGAILVIVGAIVSWILVKK